MNKNKEFFLFCANLMMISYDKDLDKRTDVETFNQKETKGFFLEKDDNLYIVFTGSDDVIDWIDDLKFDQVYLPIIKFDNLKVHQGFNDQFQDVRSLIFQKISNKNYNKVVIIGHSLGGALSSICAFYLKTLYPDLKISAVLFASPKVGNLAFTKAYKKIMDKDTIAFKYCNDPVPSLPPFFLNYFKHYSKMIWLSNGKSYLRYQLKHPLGFLFGDPLDHLSKNYLKGIQNLK